MAPSFEEALRVASGKHDLVALNICDRREKDIPDVGFIMIADPETGEKRWIDTSSSVLRESYRKKWNEHYSYISDRFRANGIDAVTFNTGEDYIKPLISFFKSR